MTLRPEHIEEALNKKTFDEIDPDEVLKHYGYKPEEVHCNGVGIGVCTETGSRILSASRSMRHGSGKPCARDGSKRRAS